MILLEILTTVNLTDFVSMKNSVLTRNPLIDINFLQIATKIEQKFFNGFDMLLRQILKNMKAIS